METQTRTCKKCGNTYPLTEEYFHKLNVVKSGFRARCKNCMREHWNNYYSSPSGNESAKKRKQKYRDSHKEQIKEHNLKVRKLYGDKYKATARKKYAENKEYRQKQLNYVKAYRDSHKDLPEYIEKIREKARISTATLSDSYIKLVIVGKTDLSFRDIPQDLIEIKRKQLKIYRNVKAKQHRQNQA